jgi:hypothetical protein
MAGKPDIHPWAVGMRVRVEKRYLAGGAPIGTWERRIVRLTATRAVLEGNDRWIDRATGNVRPRYLSYHTIAVPIGDDTPNGEGRAP